MQKYPESHGQRIPAPLPSEGSRFLEDFEKEAIIAILAASGQNKTEAARRLGISRNRLHNKMKSYGLA